MHIHILGICGTFMGGLALIGRELGYKVTGSDQNVYPPMSTQLEEQGIKLYKGYAASNLDDRPDMVVIGNALSRGNPEVEAVLDLNLPYTSGPQWLYEAALKDRWVLAVAGTHGKTTTTSMLTWILESLGLNPGFLIGGIPLNFGISARLGSSPYFVIEADEYDTAFFDKRSKFVHYRPRTAILNNLEYDHADIFPDLQAIQRQFHHLVRTVPSQGLVIAPQNDPHIDETIEMGCWTPVERVGIDAGDWRALPIQADGSEFEIIRSGVSCGTMRWSLCGAHNVHNALAAIAAAHHIGIKPEAAMQALEGFKNVKRRLEVRCCVKGVTIYDDFAHHPTAIATTLQGLRARVGEQRIIAVLEPRSNTMKLGVHAETLAGSLDSADITLVYQAPDLGWDAKAILGDSALIESSIESIVQWLKANCRPGDHVIFMSNGGFGGIHGKAEQALKP